ncbi:hypothetical protein C8R44DRAFT_791066 [Mycena epipterygia]|nr:hypothetical protein C8R44DRAFT_791066 [Mycena epipterygia]
MWDTEGYGLGLHQEIDFIFERVGPCLSFTSTPVSSFLVSLIATDKYPAGPVYFNNEHPQFRVRQSFFAFSASHLSPMQ